MKVTSGRTAHWEVLHDLIHQHGWMYGAELGLMRGRTYDYLLKTCPSLVTLIGVDVFKHLSTAPGEQPYRDVDHEENFRTVQAIADKYGHHRAMLKVMTTTEAADTVPDDVLDFVFIDADHSYEGVQEDIRKWHPKVRAGGAVIGHDYAPYWRGLVRAVHEAYGDAVELPGCKLWVHYKPGSFHGE